MKYRVVPAAELTPDLIQIWSRLQQADPALDSPYFRPEFTLAVASVRDTSEIAVFEENGEPVGFLPYDRLKRNVGHPIAPDVTDFQGAIVRQGVVWNAKQMVRDCGLAALYFDHLIVSQRTLQPYRFIEATSPYLDLSQGFDAYRKKRVETGGNRLKTALRKARKIERELGPIRLELFSDDRDVFRTLIEWKTNQYVRTKAINVFAESWKVQLLERLLDERSDAFSGVLSALYAGDRLTSIHMGMMSHGVLHYWFPAYDVELHRYSPGLVQLIRTAQAAEDLGIKRMDLGKGPESYKTSLMSGTTTVAEAAIDIRPIARPLRQLWLRTQAFVRSSWLHAPARLVARNFRYLTRLAQAGVSK